MIGRAYNEERNKIFQLVPGNWFNVPLPFVPMSAPSVLPTVPDRDPVVGPGAIRPDPQSAGEEHRQLSPFNL